MTVEKPAQHDYDQARAVDLTVVRDQMIAYARLYERIRQQMTPSSSRTDKMQEVFDRMKSLANAAFPLLPSFVASHSPGEKLAAVSILECFGNAKYLEFLVELIGSEKPFIGYHAALALKFAVSAVEPRYYPQLRMAIADALGALDAAIQGFDSDRKTILARAQATLGEAMETITLPAQPPYS